MGFRREIKGVSFNKNKKSLHYTGETHNTTAFEYKNRKYVCFPQGKLWSGTLLKLNISMSVH